MIFTRKTGLMWVLKIQIIFALMLNLLIFNINSHAGTWVNYLRLAALKSQPYTNERYDALILEIQNMQIKQEIDNLKDLEKHVSMDMLSQCHASQSAELKEFSSDEAVVYYDEINEEIFSLLNQVSLQISCAQTEELKVQLLALDLQAFGVEKTWAQENLAKKIKTLDKHVQPLEFIFREVTWKAKNKLQQIFQKTWDQKMESLGLKQSWRTNEYFQKRYKAQQQSLFAMQCYLDALCEFQIKCLCYLVREPENVLDFLFCFEKLRAVHGLIPVNHDDVDKDSEQMDMATS